MDANSTRKEVEFKILKATGIWNMKGDEESTDDDSSSSELLPRVNWIRKSNHTPYVDAEAHSGLLLSVLVVLIYQLLIYLLEDQTIKPPVKVPKVVNKDSMPAEADKDSFVKGT